MLRLSVNHWTVQPAKDLEKLERQMWTACSSRQVSGLRPAACLLRGPWMVVNETIVPFKNPTPSDN